MRIAVWHNLPSGGGKRALWDQVRMLLELGHKVESWCPPTADQNFLPLGDLVREHIVQLRQPVCDRWMAIRDVARDALAAAEAMEQHARECLNPIESRGFDVLYGNSCMFYRTNPLGRLSLLPSTLYLQEPYRWLYEALPEPPWAATSRPRSWLLRPALVRGALAEGIETRRRRIQIRTEVENAKGYGQVLSNSEFSRESILRAYGLDSQVCYLSVDTDRLQPPTVPREDFYLTIGACVREKNVDWIVRALAGVRDRWPLVWVCNTVDPGYLESVKELASALDVKIIVHAHASQREVDGLLRSAGLFLYSPRLEPFGLAPLEAAASALPTVVRREAGTRETVLHGVTGIAVGPSESEFAEAVSSLMGDPRRRAELAANAREWAERNWSLRDGGLRLERALKAVMRSSGTQVRTTSASIS